MRIRPLPLVCCARVQ